MSPPDHCLPPTYWFSTELALMEDADGNSSAVLTLVKIGYNDPLAVSNFGISIPRARPFGNPVRRAPQRARRASG